MPLGNKNTSVEKVITGSEDANKKGSAETAEPFSIKKSK